ncbi:MAG: magnesium transporter CorA family protein [Patescibacteria group bacterium]
MRNIIKGPTVTWVDIQNSAQEDVEYLRKTYQFHPLILDELIPPASRTKVESFSDHLFFVYYFPVFNKTHRHTTPRELDVIVGKDVLVTSHYNSIIPLKALFDSCNLYEESRNEYMNGAGAYLLFQLFKRMQDSIFIKLDRINKKLHQVEEQIFQGKEREMLKEISFVKTDIINFWRIVNPQGEVLESLTREGGAFFGREFEPYFTRLLGEWSKAKNDLVTSKETIESLEQTNNALLTDKTNEIVKLLTLFSVIFLPAVLITGIFSMNVGYIPLVGIRGDFWLIVGLMGSGVASMIWYFKKKKWI